VAKAAGVLRLGECLTRMVLAARRVKLLALSWVAQVWLPGKPLPKRAIFL